MPFDGKGFEQQLEQDEVLALLRRARERVAEGWCRVYLERGDKVCAIGAVYYERSLFSPLAAEAIDALYAELPERWRQRYSTTLAVSFFNDVLWPWQKRRVIALFDRAIARRAAGGR